MKLVHVCIYLLSLFSINGIFHYAPVVVGCVYFCFMPLEIKPKGFSMLGECCSFDKFLIIYLGWPGTHFFLTFNLMFYLNSLYSPAWF